MAKGFILAIDQGTTNTKALLVDATGEPVFRVSAPVPLIHSQQGFVEQDPMLLWDSVVKATAECVAHAGAAGVAIEAIAISNQRETAVAWDASTGKPVANAVSWQCGRAAGICDRLAPYATEFRNRTGLPLAPLVSAGKWAWLLENDATVQSLAREERLRFGTVDSWLIHQLTKGEAHVTDLSNASRTGLLNLEESAMGFRLARDVRHSGECNARVEAVGRTLWRMHGNSRAQGSASACRHWGFARGHVWTWALRLRNREGHLWNRFLADGADGGSA